MSVIVLKGVDPKFKAYLRSGCALSGESLTDYMLKLARRETMYAGPIRTIKAELKRGPKA